MGVEGLKCVVTGGSGFTGQRLVEMLVERGAARVVSFDIAPKPPGASEHPAIEYLQGDLTKKEDVDRACQGVECVFHIAALVGPFHKKEAYMTVNYEGTLHVLDACRKYAIPKLIMSSSPSTRFDGNDIDGLREDQLATPKHFLQLYAESKAMGEKAVLDACSDSLMTVAIAPHQIYGPRDPLFFPGLLEPMDKGQLRVFGNGKNKVSFTYVDNYCHGLILGVDSLYKDSPALGKFYIVTDGGWQYLWGVVNRAGTGLGFTDLFSKTHLPTWLMLPVGYICNVIGWVLGRKLKVSPFTFTFRQSTSDTRGEFYYMARLDFALLIEQYQNEDGVAFEFLTDVGDIDDFHVAEEIRITVVGHLKRVKMLTIHRWFDVSAAERELKYSPIVSFEEGFAKTRQWLKEDWYPKYQAKRSKKTV